MSQPDSRGDVSPDAGYTIVIPTRYGSSRFPGKMLVPLCGRPMVLHALDRARASAAARTVVATDDARIADVCAAAGADVEMTDPAHPSGTDRIAEVAARRGWSPELRIVGLQGDEPATPPEHLDALADALLEHPDADMATLARPVVDAAEYADPDRVKVVTDARGMALYFSRAPIPWRRDPRPDSAAPAALLHVGLYAYRRSLLARYGGWPESPLEREERLEQLRVLHHGGRIHVGTVGGAPARGVDRPEDVPAAEAALEALARA